MKSWRHSAQAEWAKLAQDWTSSGDPLLYENWNRDTRSDVLIVETKSKRITRLPWNTEANDLTRRWHATVMESRRRELFYISPENRLVALAIEPGPFGVTTGTSTNLFRIRSRRSYGGQPQRLQAQR